MEVLIPSVEVETLRGEVTCLEACNNLIAELEIKAVEYEHAGPCYNHQMLLLPSSN